MRPTVEPNETYYRAKRDLLKSQMRQPPPCKCVCMRVCVLLLLQKLPFCFLFQRNEYVWIPSFLPV